MRSYFFIFYGLILLFCFSDQQGLGSGGFPGGQRRLPPGPVALRALHRVWDHHLHLRRGCAHLLPVC